MRKRRLAIAASAGMRFRSFSVPANFTVRSIARRAIEFPCNRMIVSNKP